MKWCFFQVRPRQRKTGTHSLSLFLKNRLWLISSLDCKAGRFVARCRMRAVGQERTVGAMTIKDCSAARSRRSTLEFTGAARLHRATFGGMMG